MLEARSPKARCQQGHSLRDCVESFLASPQMLCYLKWKDQKSFLKPKFGFKDQEKLSGNKGMVVGSEERVQTSYPSWTEALWLPNLSLQNTACIIPLSSLEIFNNSPFYMGLHPLDSFKAQFKFFLSHKAFVYNSSFWCSMSSLFFSRNF